MTDYTLEQLKLKPLIQWSMADVMWLVTFATKQTEEVYSLANRLNGAKYDLEKALEAKPHG